MLIKVLHSNPKDIDCEVIDTSVNIDETGDVWACCPEWVAIPFGNILRNMNLYTSYCTRIIKLSALNKTYCFCNLNYCKYCHSKEISKKKLMIDTVFYNN